MDLHKSIVTKLDSSQVGRFSDLVRALALVGAAMPLAAALPVLLVTFFGLIWRGILFIFDFFFSYLSSSLFETYSRWRSSRTPTAAFAGVRKTAGPPTTPVHRPPLAFPA